MLKLEILRITECLKAMRNPKHRSEYYGQTSILLAKYFQYSTKIFVFLFREGSKIGKYHNARGPQHNALRAASFTGLVQIKQTCNICKYPGFIFRCYDQATDRKIEELDFESRHKHHIVPVSKKPISTLKPTKPPIQWVPSAFPRGQRSWGVNLTTRFHLVPWLRTSVSIPPLHMPKSFAGTVLPLSYKYNTNKLFLNLLRNCYNRTI